MTIHEDIAILAYAIDFEDPELIVEVYCNLMSVDDTTARLALIKLEVECEFDEVKVLAALRKLLVDEGFLLQSQADAL